MKKLAMVFSLVFAAMLVMPLQAQNLDGVRLFQSYFFDAPIAGAGYGQGGLTYSGYDGFSSFSLGVMGGYPINPQIELGTQIHYLNWSPDKGDGQSGITDLDVFGRYNLYNENQTNISAGAMVSLPIGSEDIGQSSLDFGGFGAIRHSLSNGMGLVGTIGLMFMETKTYTEGDFIFDPTTGDFEFTEGKEETSYESYLNLGLGAIYPLNPQLNIVGELNFRSEGDFMMLSAGADYALGSGRLRGALGIGLDDGAPDLMLMAGYQMSLSK